jgi:phosphate-selective porin OprO/OprP
LTLVRSFVVAAALVSAGPAFAQSPGTQTSTAATQPSSTPAAEPTVQTPLLNAARQQAQQAAPASVSAARAAAQQSGQPAAAQPASQAATQPIAGFQDGFFVQSPDGNYRLLFGLVAQVDGRFALDDPLPITNTLLLRKLRPTLSGRLARYFDFKVMPDFGNGATVVQDAYFDIRFSPKLRVRTGKDKTPVGYELLIGDAFLFFPERALASNLVPNRDEGVAVQGDLSPKFYYSAGVFNGLPDGASSTTDTDSNQGKDFAARIVVQPFRKSGNSAPTVLTGLGFHVGGSIGNQSGSALPTFRTSVGQIYFTYASGTVADGQRTRISPAVFYYYKAIGAFAEFMRTEQRVRRLDAGEEVVNTGWEVTGSYVLTGEAASDRGVRPRTPFDPPSRKWGAVQALARYTEVHFDNDIFAHGLANTGAAEKAKSFTLGLNWYPASVVKYYLTYEHTKFDVGTAPTRPVENILLLRAQLGI